MTVPMPLPRRTSLTHTPPASVPAAIFFITIACRPRGRNTLCEPRVAQAVFAATEHYVQTERWHVRLLLLMPDHLHLLASFPKDEAMATVVKAWKHYLAAKHGVLWQRDFFDHRLRSHESLEAKADYIRQNPIRAGLVASAGDWPFIWPR